MTQIELIDVGEPMPVEPVIPPFRERWIVAGHYGGCGRDYWSVRDGEYADAAAATKAAEELLNTKGWKAAKVFHLPGVKQHESL